MKKTTKGKKTLPKIEIGSYHAGGIVFYIDETGEHGLVMAPIQGDKENSDVMDFYEPVRVEWGPFMLDVSGTDCGIGSGRSNTDLILAATPGIITAASVCRDLTLNGYNDWFLPSLFELVRMDFVLFFKGLIKFHPTQLVWSSTQVNPGNAWYTAFGYGNVNYNFKVNDYQVRAVRAF
jgi:hypothetical protein